MAATVRPDRTATEPPGGRRADLVGRLRHVVDRLGIDGIREQVLDALPRRPGRGSAVVAGVLALVVVAAPAVLGLPGGVLLGIAAVVAIVGGLAVLAVLLVRPWLTPWLVVIEFSLSSELRLRLHPAIGLAKDGILALVVVVALYLVWRNRYLALSRLSDHAVPLAWLGVLAALYVVNAPGGHGSPWLFGTRLLVSALLLLAVGITALEPGRWMRSLVGALTVLVPFEAAFAWLQQAVGIERLVYGWGYAYGSQVRVTSSGGLRTSGTFEDPFQLAALAIIGLTVAVFVARRRPALIIGISSIALLGATQVRTTWVQAGLILLMWAVRRGFWRQAVVLAVVAGAAGLFVLSTTTTSVRPGAPEEPLILTLNGRTDAWANAVSGWQSVVVGNGVGERGIGSTRENVSVSDAPAYDPNAAPDAVFAGNTAFLDSTYAQVLSDVGIVGVVALVGAMLTFVFTALRRVVTEPRDGAAWSVIGLVLVTMVDWIGRSALASFTTGYLTMFVIGVLIAGSGRVGSPLTVAQAGREVP